MDEEKELTWKYCYSTGVFHLIRIVYVGLVLNHVFGRMNIIETGTEWDIIFIVIPVLYFTLASIGDIIGFYIEQGDLDEFNVEVFKRKDEEEEGVEDDV